MPTLLPSTENKTARVKDRSTTDHLVVVFGPRTALAESLLSSDWADQNHLLLMARDREEAAILSSRYPRAALVTCDEVESHWRAPPTAQKVTVIVCACGLIHPAIPDWTSHAAALSRDLETIVAVLAQCRGCTVTLIFVSTALAAAPRRKRAYYVGWKYLSETIIETTVAQHQAARFCVLLPGRLVRRKTLARPLSLLHTSYPTLARRIIETAQAPKTRRQIIGLDARALVMVRGARLLIDGVLGRST